MKQQKQKRDFSCSDNKMIVKAGVIASLYAEDIAAFTGYSHIIFHLEYLKIFQDMINLVYTKLSDREIKKNLAMLTKKVDDCIDEITASHTGIMIFAELAFPEDEILLKQLGNGCISEIKESHNSAQFNFTRIAILFEQNLEKLELAGCAADRIDEFQNLCAKLVTVHQDQENYKVTRSGLTKQRVTHLNEIYAVMVQLHEVSQVVWANDKEYASRYDLPYSSSHVSDEDIFDEAEVEKEIEAMTHLGEAIEDEQ